MTGGLLWFGAGSLCKGKCPAVVTGILVGEYAAKN